MTTQRTIDGVKCRFRAIEIADATGNFSTLPFERGAFLERIEFYQNGADRIEINYIHPTGWTHRMAQIAALDGYLLIPSNMMVAAGDYIPITPLMFIPPGDALNFISDFLAATAITVRVSIWEPVE